MHKKLHLVSIIIDIIVIVFIKLTDYGSKHAVFVILESGSRDESAVVDTSTNRTVEDAARELEVAMERATAQRKTVRSAPSLDEPDFGVHHTIETLTVRKDGMAPPIADGTKSHSRTTVVQMDHDEHKYKRRSPLELLSRWFGCVVTDQFPDQPN